MEIYNLNCYEFSKFAKQIKYGFIDSNGNKVYNTYVNPTDEYHLQTPEELIKNNIGLCFDIVELYRDYLIKHNLQCETYFICYHDKDILESHSFIVYRQKNNLWYEGLDNSWENDFKIKGFHDRDILVKSIYEWFQEYVASNHENIDKTLFYLNKYPKPNKVYRNEKSLFDFCYNRPYLSDSRIEFSGMSIVFCQGKVLVLETRHNEFVFPKGHIEAGETSKDASIRECHEESGISIGRARYFGECGKYSYTFSGGHLKITNDDFYKTFNTNSITKTIYVHVYEIPDFQSFNLEYIFTNGLWINIEKVNEIITHENTKEIFLKSLDLYNKQK